MRTLMVIIIAAGSAWGQAFEVASVKVVDPQTPIKVTGGPGTADPGRWICTRCSLFSLVTHAYGVWSDQVTAPEWTRSGSFEVDGRIPAGATRDQFRLMLQKLLAERFKLEAHREQKEQPVYELVVAKGGHKMTDTSGGPPPPAPEHQDLLDRDGFPNVPGAFGTRVANGRGRMQFRGQIMANVAHWLIPYVGRPVVDATGLTGKYAFTMSWYLPVPGAGAPDGPDIFRALQEQLGLKLEAKKGAIEMLVVDRAEKTPVAN